ncbi:unnamed protein product, partial [Discosporangium mesarthrocarpum]
MADVVDENAPAGMEISKGSNAARKSDRGRGSTKRFSEAGGPSGPLIPKQSPIEGVRTRSSSKNKRGESVGVPTCDSSTRSGVRKLALGRGRTEQSNSDASPGSDGTVDGAAFQHIDIEIAEGLGRTGMPSGEGSEASPGRGKWRRLTADPDSFADLRGLLESPGGEVGSPGTGSNIPSATRAAVAALEPA